MKDKLMLISVLTLLVSLLTLWIVYNQHKITINVNESDALYDPDGWTLHQSAIKNV